MSRHYDRRGYDDRYYNQQDDYYRNYQRHGGYDHQSSYSRPYSQSQRPVRNYSRGYNYDNYNNSRHYGYDNRYNNQNNRQNSRGYSQQSYNSRPYKSYSNNYNSNNRRANNNYYSNESSNRNYHSSNKQQTYRKAERTVDNFDYSTKDWKDKIERPTPDTRKKTEDVTNTKGATFEDFGLKKQLLRGLYEYGFEKPSPVQEESIPCILKGKHVLARAKNGTGKTAAYTVPMLQSMNPKHAYIQGLVLVPTRELAMQTAKVVESISKYLDLTVMCATGGTSLKLDLLKLNKTVHIIVGTPGRVLDLAQSGQARFGRCNLICCDEADKLLSEDFSKLVQEIFAYTPKKTRQIMLFSATFPSSVQKFCDNWLKDREQLNLMNELTLKGVTQYYAYVAEKDKVHCLYTLIKKLELDQCIVFCRSVNRVELLARKLNKLGYSCFYIHSKMNQSDRNRVFEDFRAKKSRFLVCTDLITRGIDIKTVNIVINFDFPKAAETYLHRIGRGGRFGHLALAINFICEGDRNHLYELERALGTEINPIPQKIDTALYAQ